MAFDMAITARGQFTLNKGSMEHLGVRPGEKVTVSREPDGTIRLAPAKRKLSLDEVLSGIRTCNVGSVDEINERIAEAYGEAGRRGLE